MTGERTKPAKRAGNETYNTTFKAVVEAECAYSTSPLPRPSETNLITALFKARRVRVLKTTIAISNKEKDPTSLGLRTLATII
jgi:hypothetical protein